MEYASASERMGLFMLHHYSLGHHLRNVWRDVECVECAISARPVIAEGRAGIKFGGLPRSHT